MNIQISDNSYWVFDLDDTLYKEVDYRNSGFEFIRKEIIRLYQRDIIDLLVKYYDGHSKDIFSDIINLLGLPQTSKDQFIWMYRNHHPTITIDNDVLAILRYLKNTTRGVSILTDGRTITQRNKINALCLQEFTAYISEEFNNAEKPDPLRFELIQSFHSDCDYIYVGDNVNKDFITPNNLGWKTIGILDDGRNIHSQNKSISEQSRPHIWLQSILELKGIILC
ncbi:HAD family hydrolase [Citrobacter freundii]|uniref:HAD family hydrolase n=1 Tax=Citrobacter freundii TaxID=546 RepID=A0AAE7GVT5_CITFR|nr:HAD family hydrolase [Citrobacter freundii]QLO14644.1 HAD family hydrolase [Citrobacter freundii]QLO42244.1 HAD family hydrolase [Citrobacter freundii]QLV40408.1 HAD family hydrolase [Citrobacter freundii]QMG40592.1 HAD family hydrolase [Citrobacter freundii]